MGRSSRTAGASVVPVIVHQRQTLRSTIPARKLIILRGHDTSQVVDGVNPPRAVLPGGRAEGGRKRRTQTRQNTQQTSCRCSCRCSRLAAGPKRCNFRSPYSSHNRGGDLLDLVLDAVDLPGRVDQLPLHSGRLHTKEPQRMVAEEPNHASSVGVLSEVAQGVAMIELRKRV